MFHANLCLSQMTVEYNDHKYCLECFKKKYSKHLLEKTKQILLKYFNNVEIQDNDILINNKKVAGATSFGTEDFFFLIYHFSMSDKEELITAICGAPTSGKQPGYIDTTILSTKQLMEDFLSWLQGL